jgi:hypothetical protein
MAVLRLDQPHIIGQLPLQKGFGSGTLRADQTVVGQIAEHIAVQGCARFLFGIAEMTRAIGSRYSPHLFEKGPPR